MQASDFGSSRIPSVTSSKIKLGAFGRVRKTGCERNVASALLQQRHALRVIHENVDVTPKPLVHAVFSTIDENQMTALETIGLFQIGSGTQLMTSSRASFLRTSSSKSISIHSDDLQMKSLLSTQVCEFLPMEEDEDAAPLQFFLPSDDSAIFAKRPETVTITLKETQTFFVFEMPQITEDLQTPEGQEVVQENENYKYVTVGPGSNRKMLNVETQTINVLTKSRGTYCGLRSRRNQGMFVNNWVIHDTYAAPELMVEKNGRVIVHTKESMQRMREAQELRCKLPKPETIPVDHSPEDQLSRISRETGFLDAARVMERIIANNVFAKAQKRFTGLIKRDPCALDLEFNYRLDLLWTFACEMVRDRPVTTFRWSTVNASVLAVAYGAKTGSDRTDGVLLIWCAKNPSQPSREYTFDSPLSDINWSKERPNLLAIGFHDGSVKIVDVSANQVNIIRQSQNETSAACSPHWQVQWWSGDEQFDYQEQIYTCDQDGRIYCYHLGEDFIPTEIMRLYRVEGKLGGVSRTDHCVAYDVPISRQPGALILRRHPIVSNVYFVGSDEGCVYQCSTNYLRQHVNSFLAHDGPIYSFEFSPFCQKLFLTCGADWCIRIWVEGLSEPLITLSTAMACVRSACWSPTSSTIIASVVNDQICVWDIHRKTHTPTSVTISTNGARLIAADFTANGNQLVIADVEGTVYVYNLEGLPFPPFDQTKVLIESICKALITKPKLLKKLKKLGPPF